MMPQKIMPKGTRESLCYKNNVARQEPVEQNSPGFFYYRIMLTRS